MSKCLNLSDRNVAKLVKDFGETTVSQMVDTYFGDNVPTYDEFIANKEIKEQLNIIPISKVKNEIGTTFPKLLSTDRIIQLKQAISKANNNNYKAGNPEVYMLVNYDRVGEADLYTWGLRKVSGTLDVEAKIERAKAMVRESVTQVSDLERMIENNEHFLPEEDFEIDNEQLENERQARELLKEDAERAGLDYDDRYLYEERDELTTPQAVSGLFSRLKEKLQQLYPAITLNISETPLWEKGSNVLNQQDYNNEVSFRIKTVDILTSPKADEVFKKGLKNKWPLDKILTELQVPKQQKQLIDSVLKDMPYFEGIPFNAQIAYAIADTYTYTVEINTATEDKRQWGDYFDNDQPFDNERFILNDSRYSVNYDENTFYGYLKDGLEITEEEFKSAQKKALEKYKANENTIRPTSYYDNLTVPGGTNYTENEIATPGITPNIKGHAQFATKNGIGWFRSDDATKREYTTRPGLKSQGTDDFLDMDFPDETTYTHIPTKIRRILEVQSDLFQKGRDREDLITITEGKLYSVPFDMYPNNVVGDIIDYEGNSYKLVSEYEETDPFMDIDNSDKIYKNFRVELLDKSKSNEFLQLLNKDNNWVNFFVKSIIQDSAKKGYEKVLFPKGDTASKVEGHTTLEEFKKQKEDRIKTLYNSDIIINNKDYYYYLESEGAPNKRSYINGLKNAELYLLSLGKNILEKEDNLKAIKNKNSEEYLYISDYISELYEDYNIVNNAVQRNKNEINQLKQELANIEGPQGFGALRPIYNFYENTVANVLKKQGYTPEVITDEYGNQWNQVTVNQVRDLQNILLQRNEADRIIGQANIQAMSVLVDAVNQKEDTLPHEYAHHYIAWFRNTPLVQEAISKWGSEEALVQSIGEQAVAQKGEAWGWWKKFTEWVMSLFDNLSTKDKQELTNILTDAFLQGVDLQTGKIGISAERSRELAAQASGIFNQTIEGSFDEQIQNVPGEYSQQAIDTELDRRIESQRQMDTEEASVDDNLNQLDPDNQKTILTATAFAEKLADAIGADYKFVSEAEAEAILANSPTLYGGQSGFYHANTVYLVKGRLSLDTVLHEFAHPLVKGILKQNPKLFNNLYAALASTPEGQDIIERVRQEYPNLQEGTDRFKEEAIVTSLEIKAVSKVNDNSPFGKFIKNLMFAIKKVLRSMFNTKNGNAINLNKLSENTTLDELAGMLSNPEFTIMDMELIPSDIAEFKNEITAKIEELNNVPKEKLQETIDRVYTDTLNQLNTLKQAPFKVKQELLSAKGTKILGYIREELEKYQTVNVRPQDVDPENVIKAITDHETEMKLRSLALINSLNELKVFTDSIKNILEELEKSKDKNTNANISKVVYYKGFLNSQMRMLEDLKSIPELDRDGEFFRKINSIADNIKDAEKKIYNIEFNFISEFFNNETDLMASAVENNFRERVTLLLKAEGIPEADIEKFIDKVISNPDGTSMTVKDIELPISSRRAKYVVDAAKEYFFKRLGRQQIEEYLRGERGDLGFFTAWITPYSNMDDPITGGFVKFIKEKMNDAMMRSQNQANDITLKLLPLLNAVGYNPRKTNQLGDMLLFTDKVGFTNSDGVYEEKDVLTFLNKFKNYRADRARLQNDFDLAKSKKDQAKMKEAYEALEIFDEKYMHRKFTKEYYDIQKIWKTGAKVVNPFTGEEITITPKVAFDSFLERQEQLNKMSTLKNVHFLELEDLYELGDSEEQAKLEYNRLFDIYNLDGKPKTGEELQRVLLRKKHREQTRNMYDYSPDTDRLQKDLDNFAAKLKARNIDPEALPEEGETMNRYQKEMDRFFRKNLKTAYTSKYYQSRQQIFEDIRKITEKAGVKSKVALELSELYKERYRLANSTADANGQPNGLNFTASQIDLLRDIENKILALEASYNKKTGLTQEETARLNIYMAKVSAKVQLSPEENQDFLTLYKTKNDMGLTELEMQTLNRKFAELAALSVKEPTDYYIEAFNYAIRNTGLPEITADNADIWINSDYLTQALAKDKDFAQWYTRNHIEKQVYEKGVGMTNKNYRLNVWTITKPSNENAYQKTTLIDPVTGKEIIKEGVPAGKYSKSIIKNEFLTIPRGANWDQYVGTYIDNRGNYLPREYKPGDRNTAYDNKYMNEKYAELEKANNAEFQLLKTISEEFIKLQDGKAVNSRLYLDLPRFRKRSNLEFIQSGETKENIVEKVGGIKGLYKSWFGKAPDDVEYGFNFDAGSTLTTTDLEGNPVTKIPVRGTYNLDSKMVSKDVLRSMYEYLLSLNEQQILMENEPVADALLSVLSNNPIKDLEKLDKGEFKLTGKKKYISKEENKREKAVKYLIDKVFYGKSTTAFEEENPRIAKMFQGLFRRSSRAFIAFDPQSAIKNRWGQLYQNSIMAAGGRFVTPTSLAKGKLKAKQTATYWVFKDVYEKGIKTPDIQLVERFDPSLRTESEFGKSASRSIAKDLLDMTYAFDFRRTMEFEASMELFWGVMYNKYVNQNGESIPYADAWTSDAEGRLVLKEGIDPNFSFDEVFHRYTAGETLDSIAKKYNISVEALKYRADIESVADLIPGEEIKVGDASEFKKMKLLVQGVNKKVTGSLDKFDTPQAEKYLFYRAFTFYKRFATGMFLDKYQIDTTAGNRGGYVYNWDTQTLEKGYYMQAFQSIYKLIKSIGRDWAILTPQEKVAMTRLLAEGVLLFLLAMIVGSWGFDWDPEDPDRYKQMKRDNKTWSGYFGNHLMYLLMTTKSENEAFLPLLGIKDQISYFSTTTIATTNTIQMYIRIMFDLWNIATDNPDAIYSKQDQGPYKWQKKGKYKLWNHIGSMYGVKGKNKDPMWAVKKFEQFEATK